MSRQINKYMSLATVILTLGVLVYGVAFPLTGSPTVIWVAGLLQLLGALMIIGPVAFFIGTSDFSIIVRLCGGAIAGAILLSGLVGTIVWNEGRRREAVFETLPNDYRGLVIEEIQRLSPGIEFQLEGGVLGRDGRRRIDIAARAVVDGQMVLTLIDVYDDPAGDPVGPDAVDNIVGRKTDLEASAAVVFSNTGFNAAALRRGRRLGIGLLSVLRRDNSEVIAVIDHEAILRRVATSSPTITLTPVPEDAGLVTSFDDILRLTYEGSSVASWLAWRAFLIALDNPEWEGPIQWRGQILAGTSFDLDGQQVHLESISLVFTPSIEWFSLPIRIDASAGVYDYLRGGVHVVEGQQVITEIKLDDAVPIDRPQDPPRIPTSVEPGTAEMKLVIFGERLAGWDLPPANLDSVIDPADLETRAPLP